MSMRYFWIMKDISHQGNCIPSGRQLPRTPPPLRDVKRRLDFSNDDVSAGPEEPHQDMEVGVREARDEHDQNGTFGLFTPETKTKPFELNSMLKGMKGYLLTASDLEFIKSIQEEKHFKKSQEDLEHVQRSLNNETTALENACDLRGKAQAELSKFPSCEDLTEWLKVVLQIASLETDLTDVDTKCLLNTVTVESVRTVTDEKKIQLARLQTTVANKRKKEAEERGWLEKQIAGEQLKIQGLMSQLSDLTSELAQEEELYEKLQMRLKTQEETPVAAEDDSKKDSQAGQSRAKCGGRRVKKGVESLVKVKDAAKQQEKLKSTKNKRTGGETQGDPENKSMSKKPTALTEELKSEASAVKAVGSGKASREKKVKEPYANSQDTQAVRGRRKPPGTVALQPKNHHTKSGDAEATRHQAATSHSTRKTAAAAEDAQNPRLRRSRRIASKRSKV